MKFEKWISLCDSTLIISEIVIIDLFVFCGFIFIDAELKLRQKICIGCPLKQPTDWPLNGANLGVWIYVLLVEHKTNPMFTTVAVLRESEVFYFK